MGTKVNSNYEDLITYTRASKGHALRPVSYGTELVTNGTFDTDTTGWTSIRSSLLSVESGRLRITNDGNGNGGAVASVPTTVDNVYQVEVTGYHGTAGGAKFRLGTTSAGVDITADITQTDGETTRFIFVAPSSTAYITLYASSGTTTGVYSEYDNISVKEVLFDQPDGTLTLFEHPDNVPRVEWDADGNRLGLLVEESRTNLITYSEDFSNAYWSKLGSSSIVSTDNLAPDGTLTASEISIGSGQSYIRRSEYSISVTDHSASFWVKAASSGSATAIRLTTNNTAAWGTGVSSKLTLTSEWQRIEVKGDLNSLAPSLNLLLGNADENNAVDTDCVGNVLVWGAQLEEASFPTSYIKSNSGSTTTRSADVASIPVADFGWNQSAGTVTVEVDSLMTTLVGNPMAYNFNNGTSQERLTVFASQGTWRFVATDGNTQQSSLLVGTFGEAKIASSFEQNKFNHCVNATLGTEDTSGTMPTITELGIGSQLGGNQLNGHIKSIQYYPRRLTNAQLVDLTS